MNTTLLNTIRTSKGFSRSVTYLFIVALVGLALERIIYYSLERADVIERENVVEKINRIAPHKARQLGLPQTPTQAKIESEKSNDTKLSEAVVSVQDTLDVLAYELLNDGDPDKAQDMLGQLYSSILDYDEQAIKDFAETEVHIEKHQLADVIKQRHEEMVSNYRTEMDTLLANIRTIDSTKDADDKLDVVLTAIKQLEGKQLKRSQQPFDPNNLPFRSARPNPENKPKTSPDQFVQAGLFSNPFPQYAALGDYTYDNLPGANNPEYLAETDEVVVTDAIRAKAEELEYDPVKIYHWVLNNVEWLPTWGSMQDADITLGSLKGNAFDISSLLIALLRASQIPARYVHGTIDVPEDKYRNWIGGFNSIDAAGDFASSGGVPTIGMLNGGKIAHIRMEHIWVEAAIDYAPSRGAINKDADSWMQMDPSYKQYDFLQGLDVAAVSTLDEQALTTNFVNSGMMNETEGWVSGLDVSILHNTQNQLQTELEDYIANNMTETTVGNIIGGRKTIIKNYPVLPSSLTNHIVVTGARYARVPASLQDQVQFSLGRDVLGQVVNPVYLPWVKVNNHKVTLSFKPATIDDEAALASLLPQDGIADINQLPSSIPAYLINVIPEIKIDGQVITQGIVVQLGTEIDLTYSILRTGQRAQVFSSPIESGSFVSITTISGNVSSGMLQQLEAELNQSKLKLDSGNLEQITTLNREDLLGDMFFAGTLGYFAQYVSFGNLMGMKQGGFFSLLPSLGTYGYVPKVSYFFGFPRAIEPGGIQMDLDNVAIATAHTDRDKDKQRTYVNQLGILSSALEHAIPEQMFTSATQPVDAISAVKALSIANDVGQRIYHVTQSNKASALLNINHSADIMVEINNALYAGKDVITHTDTISVPGWTGTGYIILDPENGDGAYKIGGGLNGGTLDFWDKFALIFGLKAGWTDAMVQASGTDGPVKSFFSGMAKFFAVLGFVVSIADIAANCNPTGARAMILILTATIIMTTLLLALIVNPIIGFFAAAIVGQIISQFVSYLKTTPLCKI